MFWPDPTHQSTQPPSHPPNHTPTHGWGILHRFQIFKWNWNILIRSRAIEFWLILRVPPGGGGWVDLGGAGERVFPTYVQMHVHVCMHMHACVCMTSYGIPRDSPKCGRPFAWNYHVYHACMCMCACACVWGYPNHPHPQSCREPKTPKFNSIELIKIIQFCLKILYLWTFLNSYRL